MGYQPGCFGCVGSLRRMSVRGCVFSLCFFFKLEKRLIYELRTFHETVFKNLPTKTEGAKKSEGYFKTAIDSLSTQVRSTYDRWQTIKFLCKYIPDKDKAILLQYDEAIAAMVADFASEYSARWMAKEQENIAKKAKKRKR